MKINKKKTFIIAELSANHNHDFDLAVKTLEAIAKSGADAVKIQTYKPESLVLDVDNEYFGPIPNGLWKGVKRYDLYKQACTPYEWHPRLQEIATELGLIFFSSPFDFEGVDFLADLNIPIYKIASFEINDLPLIRYAAQKGKPMIISTGLGDINDIEKAITTCHETGNHDITLLKCTSEYPASYKDANLLTIPDMKQRFQVKVGVSDHTMGGIVPITAVALGAEVVEKHFILSRSLGGPDSVFSMEPEEFRQMVDDIRKVEETLGVIGYEVSEEKKRKRRSLYASEDIKAGEFFTTQNIRSLRPGFGLAPLYYDKLIGTKCNRDLRKGDPLTEQDLEF